MAYRHVVGPRTHVFADLATLMAKATPVRSGDRLAGIAASSAEENAAARWCLAAVPLAEILARPLIPYESDDVTRLILDTHDAAAFTEIAHLTVGDFRDVLLTATSETLARIAPGITPEIAAAVSKIMRNQDLISVARKCRVVTRFRNTIGLPGTLAVRLQPNHPTDDPKGITAAILDGLALGCGDAVIGINPASDSVQAIGDLLQLLDALICRHGIPTQACVLTHVTTTLAAMERGLPVDLVFQSIAGTEKANASFGVTLSLLKEAHAAALALKRGPLGDNCMYFETGQGSALSADAHHGIDQQTLEARATA
jgi:ethanolamine ammonia-lyase large subunit